MLTAEHARKITDENSLIPIEFTLEEIEKLIKKSCEKGKLDLYINGNIGLESEYKLRNAGYIIDIDRKILNNKLTICYYISW